MFQRRQWLELEDQSWMPTCLRDGVTAFLEFVLNRGALYSRFVPRLADAIARSQATQVVDLCSGGGGPWRHILTAEPMIAGDGNLLLTDFFPNADAAAGLRESFPGRVDYMPLSVSAVNVPSSLIGFRTLFSSFHHFSPDQARSILADAVSKRQGIAIAESTQRHVLTLSYMLVTPVLVWMATPFYRNFSWRRVFWTYCVPIIPLVVLFDGLVSCMRTYTPEELQGLVAGIP